MNNACPSEVTVHLCKQACGISVFRKLVCLVLSASSPLFLLLLLLSRSLSVSDSNFLSTLHNDWQHSSGTEPNLGPVIQLTQCGSVAKAGPHNLWFPKQMQSLNNVWRGEPPKIQSISFPAFVTCQELGKFSRTWEVTITGWQISLGLGV